MDSGKGVIMTPENRLKAMIEYFHPEYTRHKKIKALFVLLIITIGTLTLILLIT